MYHILYKTTCLLNGRVYIGVHSTENPNDGYLGSGVLLKKAIKEHGKHNFVRETIGEYKTRKDLLQAEREHVNHDFISSADNYNLALGGGLWSNGLKIRDAQFLRADTLYWVYAKGVVIASKPKTGEKYVDFIRELTINMIPRVLNDISWMLSNAKHHNDGKKALERIMERVEYPENIVIETMDFECEACIYQ